ncbi:MAG: tetratricopeptide repeat protein [Chitinophagaceae bacterium]|nr:tetratricopeptide repeat protein [Chitinophagaceae bacterium]
MPDRKIFITTFQKNLLVLCNSVIILVYGCKNRKDKSPYEEVLRALPFSGLTDSIARFPENDDLYFRRGQLLLARNYDEPAADDFKTAWRLKQKPEYALSAGELLLEIKPDSAVSFLEKAVNVHSNDIALMLLLAQSYEAAGQTDKALAFCERITLQQPAMPEARKMMARLYMQKKDTAKAFEMLEQAFRFAPADKELCYMLALQWAEAGNKKILPLCDSLIRTQSANPEPEPYYYKGIYYVRINDKTKALQQFNEAIRADYHFVEAYIEKGALYFEMKNVAEARKTFELALAVSPAYADAYYWLARCLEAEGKKEEARQNYLKAYQLDKTFTRAREAADKLQ